ncbi:hypothetical protein CBR_g29354 [Chara braunii]|uniref:Uncharacterized protein n=1 Tax=Chara braunii TaxID=69332 RepID=A0A388JWJ3_CHABU|nr:hypothetical protein CBR_g29354 [Chara braunii]|eukprot:GBG62155.1 hypothetical protein CBR_g29354 [Chara braunii]
MDQPTTSTAKSPPAMSEEEKERIRGILSKCYTDGVLPKKLAPNIVEVGDNFVKVIVNPEVCRIQADWLREHAVQHFHYEDDPDCPKRKGASYADKVKGKGRGKDPEPAPGPGVEKVKEGEDPPFPTSEKGKEGEGEGTGKKDMEKEKQSSNLKERSTGAEGSHMEIDEAGKEKAGNENGVKGNEGEDTRDDMEEDKWAGREKRKREEEEDQVEKPHEKDGAGEEDDEEEEEEGEEDSLDGGYNTLSDEKDLQEDDSFSWSEGEGEREEEEEGAMIDLMAMTDVPSPSKMYDNVAYGMVTPAKELGGSSASRQINGISSPEEEFADCREASLSSDKEESKDQLQLKPQSVDTGTVGSPIKKVKGMVGEAKGNGKPNCSSFAGDANSRLKLKEQRVHWIPLAHFLDVEVDTLKNVEITEEISAQETKLNESEIGNNLGWWQGPQLWAPTQGSKGGVAILIDENLDMEELDRFVDPEGRIA